MKFHTVGTRTNKHGFTFNAVLIDDSSLLDVIRYGWRVETIDNTSGKMIACEGRDGYSEKAIAKCDLLLFWEA